MSSSSGDEFQSQDARSVYQKIKSKATLKLKREAEEKKRLKRKMKSISMGEKKEENFGK